MKKKYVVIFSVLIIVSVLIYIYIPKTKEEIEDTETKVNNNGFLTLMLEQDDGSYQKSSTSTWPETGYIFNDVLSNCENGGKLIWNDELKTITLKTNKSDKCYVYFDKYIDPIVNSVTVTGTTTSSISVSVSASGGTNNVATYYYSINNGAYTSSTSNTKTFIGLSKGTTYTIKVYVKDTNGVDSSVYTISAETENLTYICTTGTNLANCIKSQYTSQGSNGIYYHTSSLANSAEDNSYRYAGAEPNNYVCFGSTSSTCPNDNLYRIIGVFDSEVKLIKADYTTTTMTGSGGNYAGAYSSTSTYYKGSMNTSNIANYYWDYSSNAWSSIGLNTTNLNNTYLSYIGTTWSNKIATHTWYVGGYDIPTSSPKRFYYAESSGTTYSAKIGLMYVSDYGYAASNTYWTTNMTSYDSAINNNWMYMGLYEWTITRDVGKAGISYMVLDTGRLSLSEVYSYDNFAVRPCFYLTSSTTYISGSGTSSDPLRIN